MSTTGRRNVCFTILAGVWCTSESALNVNTQLLPKTSHTQMLAVQFWKEKRRANCIDFLLLLLKYVHTFSTKKRKARLVGQGLLLVPGVEFLESHASAVRYKSLRGVLAMAIACKMFIWQADYTSTYLNAPNQVLIFMEQPPGFKICSCQRRNSQSHEQCLLLCDRRTAWGERSRYSGNTWQKAFTELETAATTGLKCSTSPCKRTAIINREQINQYEREWSMGSLPLHAHTLMMYQAWAT